MKRSELRFGVDPSEPYQCGDGGVGIESIMSRKIALLIRENEELRRIAVDLTWQTERIRQTFIEPGYRIHAKRVPDRDS